MERRRGSVTVMTAAAAAALGALLLFGASCSGGGDEARLPDPVSPTPDVFRATPVDQSIRLSEWKIERMPGRVPGGVRNFTAINEGTVTHILSVFKVREGDTLDFNGQTARLEPGQSGTVSILLDPGTYQLACLIKPGDAGSTEDHQLKGMVTRFVVE